MLVRVHEVFNSILDLEETSVRGVEVTPEAITVAVHLLGPHRCPCGQLVAGRYDSSPRRWRHLDVAGKVLWLEALLARVWCPSCERVRTVEVPWARPGSRYTRSFEQHVAWLGQRMDLSSLARLMRCGWDAVHRILGRVVADHLVESRFDGLTRIGVDEVSYKRGHKYLTVVVDHDRRRVVWLGVGKSAETLRQFYEQLGTERCRRLEAVTMDGGTAYRRATEDHAPQALICMDPFHVMKWAGEALDSAFGSSQISGLKAELAAITGNRLRSWRAARHAVRAGQENLKAEHRKILRMLRRERRDLYRDWQLKEELRDLFSDITPELASAYLTEWIIRARREGSRSMYLLANKINNHATMIIAGIEQGLSNARLEGTNTRVKAIQRRSYGMPNPKSLAAIIYLCCGGFDIALPTRN
jgi:transposase